MKEAKLKPRNVAKANAPNDGSRSIFESALQPSLAIALEKWIKARGQGILIGRLALSFYVKPMMTEAIDLLFPAEERISKVKGFAPIGERSFRHGKTGVKVDIFTPNRLNISAELAARIEQTAILHAGIKIAHPDALVALKLQRSNAQDKADIVGLIKAGFVNELSSSWNLDELKAEEFRALLAHAHDELRRKI